VERRARIYRDRGDRSTGIGPNPGGSATGPRILEKSPVEAHSPAKSAQSMVPTVRIELTTY